MISSLPTIAKAAELIRAGEILPIDLVEFCLARIDRFEDQIHAWVMIDRDGARRLAHEQADRLSQGIDPGPLAGIPIGIKDIIDVAGWPTKAGSPLRDNHVAETDATLVAHLRAAGAIILGKTVTTQFACFDPPPTRNPWNLQHTPGGSSSGSAAAVSLEMCMAAIGTQTGGSIIRPASYCGVSGFKPTFGHISLDGVVPVSQRLDHAGPIARCVGDLAATYAVATGSDTWGGLLPKHLMDYALLDAADLPRSFTAAVATASFWHDDPPRPTIQSIEGFFFEHASGDVKHVVTAVIEKLQDAWSEEGCFKLPKSFDEVHEHHYCIMAFEAAEYHRENFKGNPQSYGPNVSTLIEAGLSTSKEAYQAAIEHQSSFQRDIARMFARHAIAVVPSTTTTAPKTDSTGDPKFNSPWSYAGVPTITIPCGIADDGLPCGLQLVGPADSEVELLQAAAWCEQRLGLDLRPPMLAHPTWDPV